MIYPNGKISFPERLDQRRREAAVFLLAAAVLLGILIPLAYSLARG